MTRPANPQTAHGGGRIARASLRLLCRPVHVAVIVFVLAAALAAGLIVRQEQYRLREERALVSNLVAERAYAIQTSVDRVLSATYALAAMLRQGRGEIPEFALTAGQLLRFYPGAASLQLAPGGMVHQVAPLRGNEKALGYDLFNDPQRRGEAALARDTRQLVLAGPFNLLHGGLAAAGYLPVFLDDGDDDEAFWGFVIVVVAFPEVLAPARLGDLADREYAYELSRRSPDVAEKQVISASSVEALVDPVERALTVPNAVWNLSVAPIGGWSDLSELVWKSAIGLLFSLSLAWQAAWQARLITAANAQERKLELRAAQRSADLQRFAEVTAHHLQEPARRVVSYAGRLRALLSGRVDDTEAQQSLDFISQQAARLQELLHDVELYLAADQPRGELEACRVDAVLSAVVAEFEERIELSGAVLRVASLPDALIDSPRLGELFRIALDNAMRHGRGERTLHIDIDGEQRGACVRYRVSDNGPGVEEQYRERVFRVFERLSSSSDGTGVGLAILRRVAESAGGRAWLDEAPGGGCCVLIELPFAGSPSGRPRTEQPS